MKEISDLHAWFLAHKRDFPWRKEKTPYRVWISEIMLQQTRASVVISYFERWMTLFPTVEKLAEAPIEEVIKAWEGLGYYSRARNIQAAAKMIIAEFGKQIPSSAEELTRLPGLGPYTIGAILGFGFHQRAAAVDGNVSRVLARYFLIEEDISKQKTKKKIAEWTEKILDLKEPWVTAEALIELGASLCVRTPRCVDCPLQNGCGGFRTGKAELLPIKAAPVATTELFRLVFVAQAEGEVLVKKGAQGQVMADLYEFPYTEISYRPGVLRAKECPFWADSQSIVKLSPVKQSFTRYLAHLFPYYLQLNKKVTTPGYSWVPVAQLPHLPFSSGHRKILKNWMVL